MHPIPPPPPPDRHTNKLSNNGEGIHGGRQNVNPVKEGIGNGSRTNCLTSEGEDVFCLSRWNFFTLCSIEFISTVMWNHGENVWWKDDVYDDVY